MAVNNSSAVVAQSEIMAILPSAQLLVISFKAKCSFTVFKAHGAPVQSPNCIIYLFRDGRHAAADWITLEWNQVFCDTRSEELRIIVMAIRLRGCIHWAWEIRPHMAYAAGSVHDRHALKPYAATRTRSVQSTACLRAIHVPLFPRFGTLQKTAFWPLRISFSLMTFGVWAAWGEWMHQTWLLGYDDGMEKLL